MVCGNSGCGTIPKSGRKFCSVTCFRSLNRGLPEPLPIPGARWVELGGHRWTLVDEGLHAEIVAVGLWSKSRCRTGKLSAHRYESGRELKLHAWVIRRILGSVPDGFVIDHKNGDSLDNRASNLRLATCSESNLNRRLRSRSGFRGVYETKYGKVTVRLTMAGQKKYLGTFSDFAQAAQAYDRAARSSHRSFALLNFPSDGEESAFPKFVQMDEMLMTG